MVNVVVNGSSSSSPPVSSGAPQGFIIGPLLFLIYINGLTELSFSPLTHIILYADDIFILSLFLIHLIYLPFNQTWIQFLLGFLLTFSKSIPQNLSTFSFLTNPFPSFSVSQSPLERVSSFRYLGILFSSSLLWSPHISFLCNKSRKILSLLFRHFSPHSSLSTIIRLYLSLVRPILEYCSIIWDPSSSTLSHSLESIQLFALKIASRFHPSLIPSLQSEFNLSSLRRVRTTNRIQCAFNANSRIRFESTSNPLQSRPHYRFAM